MPSDTLAILGGNPVREGPWPKWPRSDLRTERMLAEVLKSGRWALSGAYTGEACFERRFSKAFAAYHDVPYCTPTTSGTAALTLALLALGVGPGDEVIVPGLTWVACASCVLAIGAVPILVDVDEDTLAMSCDAASAAISERVRAIMVVHPFCTVANIDDFVALSRATGVPLIEDCSQAHGAAWKGQRVGRFGSIGCFSMQQSKVLTSGEGGAAITHDRKLYERMEQLRSDGRMFVTEGARPGRLELIEVGAVQGRNLCMSEFQAALLLDRLDHLDAENAHRAKQAATLERRLEGSEAVRLVPASSNLTTRTFYNLVLRVEIGDFGGASIDAIGRAVSEELNTSVNPIYQPMNCHPLYRPLSAPRGDLSDVEWERRNPARFANPCAERARAVHLCLGHPVLLGTEQDLEDIALALSKVRRRAADLRHVSEKVAASRWAF